MREASLNNITKFLECKRVAFVGVSRNPQHFSRGLFREFLDRGYDVVPINHAATEIEGRKCFARLSDVAPSVEAALLLTGTLEATDQAVRECGQADIRNVWIYMTMASSDNHKQAVEEIRSQGTAVVEGYCPFMFLPHPVLIHRVHRFMMKVTGSYPL